MVWGGDRFIELDYILVSHPADSAKYAEMPAIRRAKNRVARNYLSHTASTTDKTGKNQRDNTSAASCDQAKAGIDKF